MSGVNDDIILKDTKSVFQRNKYLSSSNQRNQRKIRRDKKRLGNY